MIVIENVSKVFTTANNKQLNAVNNVSIKIEDGEIYGIIGFSGAGKSTLVRCINLLERPTSGKVYIDNVDMMSLSQRELREKRKKIGMIFQQYYKSENETTNRYKDLWIFIYLCNGINPTDMLKLKFSDIVDGEICFVRQKTERTTKNRKEIRAVVSSQLQTIIDKWGNKPLPDNYIFPYMKGHETAIERKAIVRDVVKRINKRMKLIGEELGIGNITTYTARHSYATVLKRSGANISYISESLGHTDLRTTEAYLASFEKEERAKNTNLLTSFL